MLFRSVGPAFGDPQPWGEPDRARLKATDDDLLAAVCAGDAAGFLERIRRDGDRFRICGLPPTYLALRLLADARGELIGYDQCPADPDGGSLVSIGGALLF